MTPPTNDVEWVAIDRRSLVGVSVTARLWFAARDLACRQLAITQRTAVGSEHVVLAAVCEGETLAAALQRLRKAVAAEQQLGAGPAPDQPAGAKAGKGVRS